MNLFQGYCGHPNYKISHLFFLLLGRFYIVFYKDKVIGSKLDRI